MNIENAAKKIDKIDSPDITEQNLFEQIATDVVEDATRDPKAYAEQTEVPEGGE